MQLNMYVYYYNHSYKTVFIFKYKLQESKIYVEKFKINP